MNEAQRSEESGDEGANLTDLLCECYPEHRTDGGECWCQPEIRTVNDITITIHNEVN